jgi:hypothetical protein
MPAIVVGFVMNTGDSPRAQRRHLFRRRIRPRDDQVGRERDNALEVQPVRIADPGFRRRLGRPIGCRQNAYDAVACARGVEELRRVRRETHDSRGRLGEGDGRPLVVGDRDRRARRRGRDERGHEQRASNRHGRHRSPANSVAPPVEKSAAS